MILNRFGLQNVNPLQGLDEMRLASILTTADRGSYAELQWLFRYIEKRNPTARAVKRRLLSALGKLQWDIKTRECGTDLEKQARAEAQAATLRAAYDKVQNLRAALKFLALADLRGFSHLEKMYRGTSAEPLADGIDPWDVIELRPVEQWFWVKNGHYGRWEYNELATVGAWYGKPVELSKFIVREVDDPAGEVIAKLHVRQEASDSDWDGFLDDYGVPPMFVEMPPNVPPDKEAEYQRVAERALSGARGAFPNGAKLQTPSATGSGGASIFRDRLEYLDGQIVIAGTSGKLTILSESGSGTLAGEAQADAFDDIAQAVAMEISEKMQEGFDREVLERLHFGEEVLAYFEFAAVSDDDGGKALEDAGKANAAGYAIDEAELSEKSGYNLKRLPQNGILTPQPGMQAVPGAPEHSAQISAEPDAMPGLPPAASDGAKPQESAASPAAAAAAVEKALRVTPGFVAPAKSVIDDLIAAAADGEMTDAELLAFAEQMLAQIPALAAQADVAGVADALEQAMRTAVETTLQA